MPDDLLDPVTTLSTVEVNTPAGLPSIAPVSQRLAVESINAFIAAVMFP
jgi:hypothetical protein